MAAKSGAAHGSHKTTIRSDLTWMSSSACRDESIELFFGPPGEREPERALRERVAKSFCDFCASRYRCLDYALTNSEKGFWGGLSEDERKAERRRRARRAAAGHPFDDTPPADVEDLASEEAS